MLRDRLVCGINNLKYQRQILAETDLTLKKATDLAQAMEAADQNSKDLAELMLYEDSNFQVVSLLPVIDVGKNM